MKPFVDFLFAFGHLNDRQIELVADKATERVLRKDDHFWEAGKTVRHSGFLTEGVLRVYYYNDKGEAITRYFVDENHLILPGGFPDETYTASESISAVTDCTLIVFSQPDWRELTEAIPGWAPIVQKIVARQHGEKIARRSELVAQDGTERYLGFLQQFPTLVNRVPLSFIASYLGLTQSSLSRIRKNIR